jgi:hypothetical protein
VLSSDSNTAGHSILLLPSTPLSLTLVYFRAVCAQIICGDLATDLSALSG